MLTAQQLNHRLNEALAHHKAGRLDRAESIYRQLAPAAPKVALIFDLWGQLAEQQGRVEDATRYYQQACRIDERSVPVFVRLARTLIALGRAPEAETVLRRSIERNPQNAEAWNALGFVLKIEGKIRDAIACHQKALALNPKYVDAWVHYGLTLGIVGNSSLALKQYDHALTLDANHAAARYGRAETLHKVYRLEEALVEYDRYLKMVPNNFEAYSYRLFALQNSDKITREQLFDEHLRYGKLVGTGPNSLPGYDLNPDKRLRVAILSPDFRTHSCAYFIEPLLRHLDPNEFEVYLYHDHFNQDAMTARLKTLAKVFRNFVGQSHAIVERQIRADKPDILIDLTGHVGISIRLPIIAKRLAPVQITYLGYPDTTGVAAIDYRFTDAIADPPGEADGFATEKLVRFAPVAWTYQPPADAPDVVPPPCATADTITFGCFNSPTKFTDSLFGAWAQILQRVPNSRLLLKGRDFEDPAIRDHLLGWMTRCGIPAERLDLVPRTASTADHLAHYHRVDIALDTFPYNGTTTTCEALWMGRPVISLRGNRHASRVGASLLTCVGHPEWIAANAEAYVECAQNLVRTISRDPSFATGLREAIRTSRLLQHAAQASAFGTTLRECWRETACRPTPAMAHE